MPINPGTHAREFAFCNIQKAVDAHNMRSAAIFDAAFELGSAAFYFTPLGKQKALTAPVFCFVQSAALFERYGEHFSEPHVLALFNGRINLVPVSRICPVLAK